MPEWVQPIALGLIGIAGLTWAIWGVMGRYDASHQCCRHNVEHPECRKEPKARCWECCICGDRVR